MNGKNEQSGSSACAIPRPGEAFLRIDPGMHTAPIWSIGVDAAGRQIVTGSTDKTARLWALPEAGHGSPALKRVFRVPIAEGCEGRVQAVALSPDGSRVAVGASDDGVYIFEAATGRMMICLALHGGSVNNLAFSPDGCRLAAACYCAGVLLWETSDWQLLTGDMRSCGGGDVYEDAYSVAFDAANRLFAGILNGQVRRYDANGNLRIAVPVESGKEPISIALHPQGAKFAIGFHDTNVVEIYDAGNLKRLYAADTAAIGDGNISSIAWSQDGARLYAGKGVESPFDLFIWEDEGLGPCRRMPLAKNSVMQLLPSGDGIAVATQDPAFGVLAADGTKRVWQAGVTTDMRGKKGKAFTLSADGGRVRFGLEISEGEPVLFDLGAFAVSSGASRKGRLAPPRISGLSVQDWENNDFPKLNGMLLDPDDADCSRSLAIAPDGSRFVLGRESSLCAYRSDGRELWRKESPGIAWGVNISGNGKLVVAACDDGTIRWHRLSDGEELLALFVHPKDRRFIAWTPEGYYAASPGAEDLIGWHVNRGFKTAPGFYPASTFASTYNKPEIVQAALGNLDAPPLTQAEGLLGKIRRWL